MTLGVADLPQALRIREVVVETPTVRRLVLDDDWEAQPGQFAMLWLPGLDEKPFSLAGARPLTFAVAAVGPLSRALHRLQVGDRVWCRGPFGHGFEPRGRQHLLVGGGYGAAPLLFLAQHLVLGAGECRVALGARCAAELLLVDAFRSLGTLVSLATEDGSCGHHGLVTDVAADLLEASPSDAIYACGPAGMLWAVRELGQRVGVTTQLAWEAYMRCGIGLCGSCWHEGQLVCRDGPVVIYPPAAGSGSGASAP